MNLNYNFFGRLKKENGQLVYIKDRDTNDYEKFKSLIPEGSYVDLYAEIVDDDANLAQLSKIHAMIRDLSRHTGISTSDLKLVIKQKAGLCITREKEGKEIFICPSFGDASKEDLSAAIQECYNLGDELNYPLM